MAGTPSVAVVIPARNEAAAAAGVIRDVRAALAGLDEVEVLLVDDGSTDETAALAAAAGARVVRCLPPRGYGGACKRGVLATAADLVCFIDADGTYPAEELAALVAEVAEGADQAIGARTVRGARVPWARRPAKWAVTRLASLLADRPIPDLNSGMRCVRRSRVAGLLRTLPDGFSFSTTLTMAGLLDGWEVRFRPVGYHPRQGSSKFRPVRDTARLLLALVRAVVYFAPLRVFGPLALALGVSGLGFGIWDVVTEQNLTDKTILFTVTAVEFFVLGLLADLVVRRRSP